MPAQQLLEKTRERIEKLRGKAQTKTQKVRERIKTFRAGGASQGMIAEVREKGLVETLRARRGAFRASARGGAESSIGQKEYKKELALEASTGQLKIQKGRVAIEA